ncbi:FAD-NAD(P)-binding family protein [Escherichia coli ThroopD]|nr:FAD-NAD(P)-binding family protein [Escherichia coli ThroopD]
MKKIAIVGAGPTGIYTLFSLLQQQTPLSISIFEQADEAGVGMPYSDEENSKMMLANIASIEIPPINCTYLEWLQKQEASHLQRYGVKKETLHDRQFLPRILLGEYFRDQFLRLVDQARQQNLQWLFMNHARLPICKLQMLASCSLQIRIYPARRLI